MFLNKAGLDIRVSFTGERYFHSKWWPAQVMQIPSEIVNPLSPLEI